MTPCSAVIRRVCATVVLALLAGTRPAAAQCPDGALPVGGRCGGSPASPPIDPNRLAILPFRTSSADPALGYLGNGLMELLSHEFNGAVGPTAVESGEVFRAWSRAGAGTVPATQATALRVARQLGAGQAAYSSIVGSPRRFTVTVSILNVPDGKVRVPPVQVEGTEDSLPALVASLATRLLGGSAGVTGNTSNAALRAYLAGMAAYRKAVLHEAEVHFARSVQLDSTFIPPMYSLVLARALTGPSGPLDQRGFRHLWSERQRLNGDQRRLLEALADSGGMLFRIPALLRLEQAVNLLENSAEAWDILGDLYFHVGAMLGRSDWAQRSRVAFERAMSLDATLCLCAHEHLADFAFSDRDAARFARYSLGTPWQKYQLALLKGNRTAIRTARLEYVRDAELIFQMPFWLTGTTLPQSEVDSLLLSFQPLATTDEHRRYLLRWTADAAAKGGRPAQAREALERYNALVRIAAPQRDPGPSEQVTLAYAELDSTAAESLARRRPEDCEVGLSRLRRGDTTEVAALVAASPVLNDRVGAREAVARVPRGNAGLGQVCAQILRGILSGLAPSGGSLLHRADSMMRVIPLNGGQEWNYDLGVAFARRGDYSSAAAAVRRRWNGVGSAPTQRLVIGLRQEGRWSALAGDTATAIKAYRHYLLWRERPEPVLIPQRDSVRAELAALEKSPRKPKPSLHGF